MTPPTGESIRVDQLALVDSALVAVGAQGPGVGPSFYRTIAGSVVLWRSSDGIRWTAEPVYVPDHQLAIDHTRLTTSESTAIVQVFADDLSLAKGMQEFPDGLTSAIEEGTFYFAFDQKQAMVYGPLGIELARERLPTANPEPPRRLFRSDGSSDWAELDVDFDFDTLLSVPGGFLATSGGFARTSTDAINWTSYPHDAPSFYQQFDLDLLAVSYDLYGLSVEIIGANTFRTIQLPKEMEGCAMEGSNSTLAASCWVYSVPTSQAVEWEGNQLVLNDVFGLDLLDPSAAANRRFAIGGATGTYDPESDTISLLDTEGISQAFPVDTLNQVYPSATPLTHDVMISADGLVWTMSKTSLTAYEVQLLGGVQEGFLVASRSHEPNATLTVLVAEG